MKIGTLSCSTAFVPKADRIQWDSYTACTSLSSSYLVVVSLAAVFFYIVKTFNASSVHILSTAFPRASIHMDCMLVPDGNFGSMWTLDGDGCYLFYHSNLLFVCPLFFSVLVVTENSRPTMYSSRYRQEYYI